MTAHDYRLAHRHDAVEAAAFRDMVAAAPLEVRRRLGLEVHEIAEATLLVAPGLPATIFNRVIGLGNGAPADRAVLASITDVYRRAGVRNWWIHATPGPHAPALLDLLSASGFTLPARKAWVKVWRDAAPPPEVRSAALIGLADPRDAPAAGRVLSTAFGLPAEGAPWLASVVGRPGWLTTVARLDGEIVGAGMLHLQGKQAWLGVGGVLPAARRAHAHRALMAQRIREAAGRGCTGIFTETGEPTGDEPNPSLRNMEACGFRRLFSRPNYAAPAPTA